MHRFICIAANCFVCLFFDFVAIPVTVKLFFYGWGLFGRQ